MNVLCPVSVGTIFLSVYAANNEKPIDVKVEVKPVCPMLVHKSAYEGPCRPGAVSPEEERESHKKHCDRFVESVKENLKEEAVMLEPISLEFNEDYKISENQWKKLEADLSKTDLILLSGYCRAYGFKRYKKPMALVSHGVGNVDIAAYLRNNGVEGYAPYDWDELNNLISLMRVRKAVRQTKILVVTNRPGGLPTYGVKSVILGDTLEKKFGVDCKYVSFENFFEEMDRVARSESEKKKASKITDKLINNADKVHMNTDYIKNDVDFYLTVKSLMGKYNCNGFTIDCFEICPTKIPAEREFLPCLTHSLLKDEGYPSACEMDLNAFLAMALEMYIAKKSVFMGNPGFDKEKNLVHINHAEPGLKMKGLPTSDLPYGLSNFTKSGWGTTIKYDFASDKGEKVTLARFNPAGTKLVVSKGEITGGSSGLDEIGCSTRVSIRVPNAIEFFHEQANTGHHLAVVYGDYTQELKGLGDLMDFELVEIG